MSGPVVYLLHFSEAYPGGQKPQHYLGVAHDLDTRMNEHRAGSSKSRLTRACHEKGIDVELVRTWMFETSSAAFDHERALKAAKKTYRRLCPICSASIVATSSEVGARILTPAQERAPKG